MATSVTNQDITKSVDAALQWLLEQPGSGVTRVPGRVLRHAFRDRGTDVGNAVIKACVPTLLAPSAVQGDDYFLTFEGLLRTSDARVRKLLAAMLTHVSERYQKPGGLSQRSMLWSDIRKVGKFAATDFTLSWHVFQSAGLGTSGARVPGASLDERAPGFDYDYWLHEHELENIANHSTVDAWIAFQRSRRPAAKKTAASGAPMQLTLEQEAIIAELAELLYDFLPASGAPTTFAVAARRASVSEAWTASTGNSKGFRVRELIARVFTQHAKQFPLLMKEIVAASMNYRRAKSNPLRRDEVERLNALLFDLGLRIADLRSEVFLSRLASGTTPTPTPKPTAASNVAPSSPQAAPSAPKARDTKAALDDLHKRFLEHSAEADRRKAGYQLERLLTDLFKLFDLEPHSPFRVVGEQIDGAFYFDGELYLVEAKWEKAMMAASDLYSFHMKVAGKSAYTRGLFLSINGYSSEAVTAYTKGKETRIVLIDGAHLFRVLLGQLTLTALLKLVLRHLVERGEPYLPVTDLA